jgi:hypothetical protein
MLGAIMLTLRLTNNADYQDLTKQLSRDPGQSVKVS